MQVIITMKNPHNPMKPTRLVSSDCKTLDDAIQAVYFFMENCQIITITIEE